MKAAHVQKLLQEGREIITYFHETVEGFRQMKREADETGDLETEYRVHNYLKHYRKLIAQRVEIQKSLKALLKGL